MGEPINGARVDAKPTRLLSIDKNLTHPTRILGGLCEENFEQVVAWITRCETGAAYQQVRDQGSTMYYFHGLIDFVGAHPNFACAAVLLLALSEAVPVIGTVIPGSTLIIAISALATTADVKPWLLLVAAVGGAIAGDGLSFWLGHRYRREILRGWPLNRFPKLVEGSARFIRRHGVASVFLARFTAVVRAFVPLVAGILRMSSRHFYVANVLSALVWAPIHVFPGVLAGMVISVAGPHTTKVVLFILGFLILAAIAWHLLKAQSRAKLDGSTSAQASDMAPPKSESQTRSESP